LLKLGSLYIRKLYSTVVPQVKAFYYSSGVDASLKPHSFGWSPSNHQHIKKLNTIARCLASLTIQNSTKLLHIISATVGNVYWHLKAKLVNVLCFVVYESSLAVTRSGGGHTLLLLYLLHISASWSRWYVTLIHH